MSTTLEEARAKIDALLDRRDRMLDEIEQLMEEIAAAMQDAAELGQTEETDTDE